MRVAIVTDSTADLTAAEAAEHGISVVPLQVIFGERAYTDGVDLSAGEFYRLLASSPVPPTTSQPAAGAFRDVFERLLAAHDAVVGVFISGKLSGTFAAAAAAREMVAGDVTLVDSGTASYALGLIALHAAAAAAGGAAPAEVCARIGRVKERVREYILVNSLEHLRRGGRIGGAAALLGSLLQIKPVITIRDGAVDVYAKVRTEKRAAESLLARLEEDARGCGRVEAAVIHTGAQAAAAAMAERVRAALPRADVRVRELGAVIGAHVGAGNTGLVYFAE